MGKKMLEKIADAYNKRILLHTIKIYLNNKLRIAIRIKNKNVYADYVTSEKYDYLRKKYISVIKRGVNEDLPKKRSNIIWCCWLQGIEHAPDLVKSCINSLKQGMPEKRIILLNANNFMNYVDIPDYILEKWRKGVIPFAHFTDILRTALLCKYGGAWFDATVLFTANSIPDYFEKSDLFVFKQIVLSKKDEPPIVLSNWLIFSVSNHPLLLLTLQLLYDYWKDHSYLTHYFVYHLFFTMATRRYPDLWKQVPTFNNHAPHTLQFELGDKFTKERWEQIIACSAVHKLSKELDFSDNKESFYYYVITRYLKNA